MLCKNFRTWFGNMIGCLGGKREGLSSNTNNYLIHTDTHTHTNTHTHTQTHTHTHKHSYRVSSSKNSGPYPTEFPATLHMDSYVLNSGIHAQ
jgi:carbohydrate-binding DOMON domain-containing protein